MALQRSKSAPQGIPALLAIPPSLPRASSFHTIQKAVNSVKTVPLAVEVAERTNLERGDPFSLSGFFPSSLGEEKWGWLRGDEKAEKKIWAAEEGGSGNVLFAESDKLTQEAIKGEDKLGVLSLGRLFNDLEGKLWLSSDNEVYRDEDREAVDEDSLWLGLRVRRGKTLRTTQETADGDAEDWKTPIDSAIDEYFPIWDIDSGNSRDTKLPHVG
ncbi:hypothetical protein FPV67DRAFT_75145 [Lyophyllum atratum]|nr:hypothetical protein FPV67DRAFT_75145 [Lyophyllum atratum]